MQSDGAEEGAGALQFEHHNHFAAAALLKAKQRFQLEEDSLKDTLHDDGGGVSSSLALLNDSESRTLIGINNHKPRIQNAAHSDKTQNNHASFQLVLKSSANPLVRIDLDLVRGASCPCIDSNKHTV